MWRSARRAMLLSAAAGCVEVVGYLYLGGIYPGVMTGNTVQLGMNATRADWAQALLMGEVLGWFLVGCLIGSALRRIVPRAGWVLLAVGSLVAAADVAMHRAAPHYAAPHYAGAMPLLAMAMALQGEALTCLGGVSIQTIVVTNTIVKFANGLVELAWRRGGGRERPALGAALLPGVAWLSYGAGAAAGARLHDLNRHPLLIAAAVFACVALDFLCSDMAD
jgi:uncharacterized membrane protein YoaK (UPF0700 family)